MQENNNEDILQEEIQPEDDFAAEDLGVSIDEPDASEDIENESEDEDNEIDIENDSEPLEETENKDPSKKLSEWERWGKNNPEKWHGFIAKKAHREAKKEYEEKLKNLESRLEQQQLSKTANSTENEQDNPQVFVDPVSKIQIPLDSEENIELAKAAAIQHLLN